MKPLWIEERIAAEKEAGIYPPKHKAGPQPCNQIAATFAEQLQRAFKPRWRYPLDVSR